MRYLCKQLKNQASRNNFFSLFQEKAYQIFIDLEVEFQPVQISTFLK
jgi:hypothetical protein